VSIQPGLSPRAKVPAGWLIFGGVGLVLALSAGAAYWVRMRAPSQPPTIVLSACRTVAPGMHRIKGDFGTQFDVPEANFAVAQGGLDFPPEGIYTITLNERDKNTKMMVAWRDDDFAFGDLKGAFPIFSRRVGEQEIRSPDGSLVGRDHWGDLNSGERWRYVTFRAGDGAGYRPVPPKDARLFDQILSSACVAAN